MQSKKRCSRFLLVFLLFIGSGAFAQTGQIDTILVNLSSDTSIKSSKTTSEPTPALDLGALRIKAREDSIRIAQIAQEKKDAEKERIAKIKEKRREEKLEKEKEQKDLAEKRKKEKEEKKKELLAKKAAEKAVKEKAAAEKKEKEKKEAALAANEKISKQKLDKAKKAEAAKIKANEAKLAKEKEKEEEKAKQKLAAEKKAADEAVAKASKLAKEKKDSLKGIKKVATETPVEKLAPIETTPPNKSKPAEPAPAVIAKKQVADNLPKPPKGVVQKDNPYGTVRLAYDENAASFLLSIPTETKMHYHAKHSEQVMLIEGDGMLLMGYKTIKLKKNELIFITQGTPHKIINNGKAKLKVLSIQSPFYDGTDIIILE